jgi:hypothetical protein
VQQRCEPVAITVVHKQIHIVHGPRRGGRVEQLFQGQALEKEDRDPCGRGGRHDIGAGALKLRDACRLGVGPSPQCLCHGIRYTRPEGREGVEAEVKERPQMQPL